MLFFFLDEEKKPFSLCRQFFFFFMRLGPIIFIFSDAYAHIRLQCRVLLFSQYIIVIKASEIFLVNSCMYVCVENYFRDHFFLSHQDLAMTWFNHMTLFCSARAFECSVPPTFYMSKKKTSISVEPHSLRIYFNLLFETSQNVPIFLVE